MRFGVENPFVHQASATILHMPASIRILQKVSVCQDVRARSTYLDVYQPHVFQHLSEDKASLFVQFLAAICCCDIADCTEANC